MKSKEQKRQEAAERAAYWQSLTVEQKLASLRTRPGRCEKQLKALEEELVRVK